MTPILNGIDECALVDIDDVIKEAHGQKMQGSGYGYSGVCGLEAPLGIVSSQAAAPVIIGSRFRRGATGSRHGAKRFVSNILPTVKRLRSDTATGLVLLRADSAFYGRAVVSAAHHAKAKVSITARMGLAVKRATTFINEDRWTTICHTNAILDETTGKWNSVAEVADVTFTASSSRKKAECIEGRLVVRRIQVLNRKKPPGNPPCPVPTGSTSSSACPP